MKTDSRENITGRDKKHGILKRISNAIINTLEKGFYKLGYGIGKRPWLVILISCIVCGLIGLGLLRFKQTTDNNRLWVPIGSLVVDHEDWISEKFPSTIRVASFIVTDSNVLTPTSLQAAYALYERVRDATSSAGHTLENVCLKIGPFCRVSSILELWSYNKTAIDALTQQEILDMVNTVQTSPMFGNPLDVTTYLGKRSVNSSNSIIGAEATMMIWYLLGDDGDIETKAEDFERKLTDIAAEGDLTLDNLYISTRRSTADETGGSIQGDVVLLSAGYGILIAFVILSLSRFNMVEHRIWLALSGILCVGLSILVSFGLSSAIGSEYGPVHSVLPFLLLGIGVDDMFVIFGALNNLKADERQMDIPTQVGLVLRHAGVSVTVTSLTDMVAFAIGASTVLPALRSFCVFAAFGILGLYVTQTVFFTACLAIDMRRVKSHSDACICCYPHKNWRPNKCSNLEIIPAIFRNGIGPVLNILPVKIIVLIITLGVFGGSIYGFTQLKQNFSFIWFLPSDGFTYKYFTALEDYFPNDGEDGYVYCGDINYYSNQAKLIQLNSELAKSVHTYNGTVDSWYEAYRTYIASGSAATSESTFIRSVFDWAQLPANSRVLRDIKFTNSSSTATDITATRISFQHVRFPDSQAEVKGMDAIRKLVTDILPDCFPFSRRYRGWETNKVIQLELYRNLGLAFACVFVVTIILIADILISILVSTCVAFTLVDVAGFMYFWGLTIDTVTSIILILAIGLAVDYSAHVGHHFMTVRGTRKERTKETLSEMGTPVFYGGFSTFLAFILLAASNSYVFVTFFKVFFLVVVFGLYHGLIYLPVILSWIGSDPYLSADYDYTQKDEKIGQDNPEVSHIGTLPQEPPPDYDLPANGYISPSNGGLKLPRFRIPPPDYTPPTAHRTIPPVQT